MKYIFLDTNIFIHFQYFETIEWVEIVNDNDFTIVISPIVLDELDNHKYNQSKKVAKRVKSLLPKIEKILEDASLCKFNILHLTSWPSENLFAEYGLNKEKQDDWLLASMLEFAKKNPIDCICYVSYDTAPRLKAKTFNILAVKLSEKYLLVEEQDENEKKNAQLVREVNELRSQIPKISFSFNDNTELLTLELPKELNEKDYLDNELIKKRKQFSYISNNDDNSNPYNSLGLPMVNFSFYRLSEAQIIEYNKALDEYFKKYRDYLKSKYYKCSFLNESIKIKLKISNNGTTPAKNIEINLHFPDGFDLYDESGIPKVKEVPKPPYKPKHSLDLNITPISQTIRDILPNSNYKIVADKKSTCPTIKRTNSYIVTYVLDSLMHNKEFELDTLYVKFNSISHFKGFTIDYRIMVANVPNLITGKLNVKVKQ